MGDNIIIFECKRGFTRNDLVDVRVKADPDLFKKFKAKIKKNSGKQGHNVHDLFNTFIKGYVNESNNSQ